MKLKLFLTGSLISISDLENFLSGKIKVLTCWIYKDRDDAREFIEFEIDTNEYNVERSAIKPNVWVWVSRKK